MPARRSMFGTWLAVFGGLAIALGVFGLWAQRTLGDAETFAALAGDILREPRIRTELAVVIVDSVLDVAPQEIQEQRAIILATTTEVLGNERFVPVFEAVLRRAVTNLLEGQGPVRLELDRSLDVVVTEVEAVSPELAAELAAVDPPEPVVVAEAHADRLRALIAFERASSVAMLVVGALLTVLAIARGGPRALLPFGATLAGACLVLFGVLLLGRGLILSGIEPASRADAAAAAWNIVIADLRTLLLFSSGAGALAMVVGGALSSRPRARRARA